MNLVISVGRFVPWDVFSLERFVLETFCPLGRFVPGTLCIGTFCPWDLMSLGPYVLGRFVPWNVLSWDVLSVHRAKQLRP